MLAWALSVEFGGEEVLMIDRLLATLFYLKGGGFRRGCIPGSAGTRQIHMTLNSGARFWGFFGLRVEGSKTSPHFFACLVVIIKYPFPY